MKRGLALVAAALIAAAGATAGSAQQSKLFQDFKPGSDQAIQVDADRLEVTEKTDERISVFSGNVTVQRGATVLEAAVITIHSDAGAPQAGKEAFNLIEAEGNVRVTEGGQVATGDTATFNMKTQVATISGNVVLTQGRNVLTGARLVVDLNSGIARVEQGSGGRIRGIFTPNARAPETD
jgi:lipopolysaccharide export system protein LptA